MSERTRRNRRRLFQAKVTGRHAITLPAALCRELEIESGDSVELELAHRQIILRKSEEEDELERLRGILKEYFPDWAAVDDFIQEERDSWDEGMTQAPKAFRAGCEPAP
jgi:bifunctional DNA-binding transcriptional regulator/antitoxin component of YhaV-PrlF toxin-antitoxin module